MQSFLFLLLFAVKSEIIHPVFVPQQQQQQQPAPQPIRHLNSGLPDEM